MIPGECWFNDNDAESKMIDFLSGNLDQHLINEDFSIIDLGTGNGHLLFEFNENWFNGNMLGVFVTLKRVLILLKR